MYFYIGPTHSCFCMCSRVDHCVVGTMYACVSVCLCLCVCVLNIFRNSPDICWHNRPTFPASLIISSPFISVSQTKMENQLNNEVQSDTTLHIFSLLSLSSSNEANRVAEAFFFFEVGHWYLQAILLRKEKKRWPIYSYSAYFNYI